MKYTTTYQYFCQQSQLRIKSVKHTILLEKYNKSMYYSMSLYSIKIYILLKRKSKFVVCQQNKPIRQEK